MSKPILSICIPTYNRGAFLKRALDRLVIDKTFLSTDDIEIVVADNASSDNTEVYCRDFEKRFPGKFVYYRQNVNCGYSGNLSTLMEISRGEYLKFQNDYFLMKDGALTGICDLVRRNLKERPVLVFGNAWPKHATEGEHKIENSHQLIDLFSYWTTWIGGFGFWADAKNRVKTIHEQWAFSEIPQTAVIWELFIERGAGVLYNHQIFEDANEPPKSGYNVAKVFGLNYQMILKMLVRRGCLAEIDRRLEQRRYFEEFIYRRYFDFNHEWHYDKGLFIWYMRDYWFCLYFWKGCIRALGLKIVLRLPKAVARKILSAYSHHVVNN